MSAETPSAAASHQASDPSSAAPNAAASDAPPAGHAAAPVPSGARLAHLPIGLFGSVMGLSGLTIATLRLESMAGGSHLAGTLLLALTVAVFLVVGIAYLLKAIRHPEALRADWNHPVRVNFFAGMSISVGLLAVAFLPLSRTTALVLWAIGTALHLAVMLAIVSKWIGPRVFEAPTLTPAKFIPAVGNVLVPLPGVPLGFPEISWFFFTVGIVFWIVLLSMVFGRLVTHLSPPDRMLPTLMILVAPPAVAMLAYLRLNDEQMDGFVRILYYSSLLFLLVVLTQLPRLARIGFAVSWWAYSFPLAAFTIATVVYAEHAQVPALALTGRAFYVLLILLIAGLAWRTLRAAASGDLFRPEP